MCFGISDDNVFAGLPLVDDNCGSQGSWVPPEKAGQSEGGAIWASGSQLPLETLSALSHRHNGVDRLLDKEVSGQPDLGGREEQTEIALGLSVANNLVSRSLESAPLLVVQVEFPQMVAGSQVEGLIDSGASYNFVSKQLAIDLGWQSERHNTVNVRLADGSSINTSLACRGLVQIGQLQHIVPFLILDLTFDMVLGMPWLQFSNVLINWSKGSVRMRRGSRWVELPARFNGPKPIFQLSQETEGNEKCQPRGFELTSASKFSKIVKSGQQVFCCLVS